MKRCTRRALRHPLNNVKMELRCICHRPTCGYRKSNNVELLETLRRVSESAYITQYRDLEVLITNYPRHEGVGKTLMKLHQFGAKLWNRSGVPDPRMKQWPGSTSYTRERVRGASGYASSCFPNRPQFNFSWQCQKAQHAAPRQGLTP